MALKRLQREFEEWAPEAGNAPEGFMAVPRKAVAKDGKTQHDDLFNWDVVIPGPEGSLYESGHFVLHYKFKSDYPFKAPEVRFTTPIYHSHVSNEGHLTSSLCPFLGDAWSPGLSALKVAMSLQAMLADPQDVGLRMEISHLYLNNPEEHRRIALACVQEHAQVLPQSITDAWMQAFGPCIVLTLNVSKTEPSSPDAPFLLTGTSFSGEQIASLPINTAMGVAEARLLLAEQLEIPERRLKMCLPDGTLIQRRAGRSQPQPLCQFFGFSKAEDLTSIPLEDAQQLLSAPPLLVSPCAAQTPEHGEVWWPSSTPSGPGLAEVPRVHAEAQSPITRTAAGSGYELHGCSRCSIQ